MRIVDSYGFLVSTLIATVVGTHTWGCADIVTQKANLNDTPDGIRIYQPKVYILVDAEKGRSVIMYAPDYQRAYDIKPRAILAKNDFSVELNEGQMSKLTSNQDSTALLTFLEAASNTAAKALGAPVSAEHIEGTFGLPSGIYQLHDDGTFKKLPPVGVR